MNKEEKQKKLQEKYFEFQILKQHLEEIQHRKAMFNQKSEEINRARETLGDLKDIKPGKDIFAQLGGGMFVRTSLRDNKEVLMDAGANVIVSKSVEEAREFIDGKLKEFDGALRDIEGTLSKAGEQLHSIQKEILALNEE